MPIDYSKFDNIDTTDDEAETSENDNQISCSMSAEEGKDAASSDQQPDKIHMSSALLAENFSKNVAYCERNMWQLSTLAIFKAEMLLRVSIKQFYLSKQLNNEAYISRSRIYIAHALANNDAFDQAIKLINKELYYIKHYLKDDFNMRVATAIRTRIKHLQQKAITAA
uniref:Uncharacterized protein n=1 Tax=Panagrolaimus sp. ES5 TaxID=591445 RepID=A0AC34G7R6_9BILA